jgi:hypothetical protein
MENKKPTQKENILQHLQTFKKITPLEALNLYGCFRLASVIFMLKKDGYMIATNMITKGEKTFAEYNILNGVMEVSNG